MSKKLLILIVYVTFNVAFTNGDCKFGKSLVKNFDNKKFEGTWFSYLMNSKEIADTDACPEFHYNATNNTLLVKDYLRSTRSEMIDLADLRGFDSNPFETDFHGLMFQYSGKIFVRATDYTGYSILEGCFPSNTVKNFSWILFRTKNPKQDEEDAAKRALTDLGLKWEDFYNICAADTNN